MAALVAALVIQATDRTPWLAAELARARASGQVLLGFALGLLFVNTLSALGGMLIAPRLSPNAAALFLGCALAAAAIGCFMRLNPPDAFEQWRIGAFPVAVVGALTLGFGAAQFVLAAIVARSPLPGFAVAGATIGGTVAAGLGALGGGRVARRMRRAPVRVFVGVWLLIFAALAAFSALRLL